MDSRFPMHAYDPSVKAPIVPWYINKLLLGKGKIMAMFAPEKAGKSRVLSWLLTGLYSPAERVLGELVIPEAAPKRILYLTGEEQRVEITARMKDFLELQGADRNMQLPLDFVDAAGMQLDRAGAHEGQRGWFFKKYVQPGLYDLLVIDPIRRVHAGQENDNSAMAPMHNDWRRWTNEYGLSLFLIHHTGKLNEEADMQRIATWSRGNSDLATLVDGALFVQVLEDNGEARKLKMLRAGRQRFGQPLYLYDDDGLTRHLGEEA